MKIGEYTFQEFMELASSFHSYPAPGLLIGAFMVEAVKSKMPEGTLYEAVVETKKCLPDAVQLLTPCSTGNNWMRVINLGRYALSLYDKYTYSGWRVWIDPEKLAAFPCIYDWFFKLTPKKDQDSESLYAEIESAGGSYLSMRSVQVRQRSVKRSSMGSVSVCPVCGEAYPKKHGPVCRACQGETPYFDETEQASCGDLPLEVEEVPVENAVGKRVLHDMTRIVPGKSKEAAFRAGQEIGAGDLCRLQQMGREYLYAARGDIDASRWIHENEAAAAFAEKMAGPGVRFDTPPVEGKINFAAEFDGLLMVDTDVLYRFNLAPNVMCSSRQNRIVVKQGKTFAGCRAIPLYLQREHFSQALEVLSEKNTPLFSVLQLKRASSAVLVTGSEVYRGLVEDRFEPVIRSKMEQFDCPVIHSEIVPDDAERISSSVKSMIDMGVDLIVTTAGLSVDPDDRTRQGLAQAGMTDALYGTPILPGAMTLVGKIGKARVLGVPACALFYRITSLDLILPIILAGLDITRSDLASFAEGGYCLGCRTCTYPKCPFGK